jgi:hypothetical protein
MTVRAAQTAADALQAALAGEHAAVYAYGVVGGRLQGLPDQRAAAAGYDTHRQRRTTLTLLVQQGGQTPVAAAPAYELGGPVTTPAQARVLAATVEQRAAATYADVVAATAGATRSAAAGWLADSAVRQATWSSAVEAFPGLPERS